METVLEKADIQALVVTSYSNQPCAAYFLLRVENAKQARQWLLQRVNEITTSDGKGKDPEFSTNLAFTATGLTALGLSPTALETFSHAFQEGMSSLRRSRILGDVEENAPAAWDWGKKNEDVHGLLMLFARDEKIKDAQVAKRKEELSANGGWSVIEVLDAGREKDTHEHFGFNDGIGQPVMAGTDNKKVQFRRTRHATELPAGEFLLGQTNVYGVIADGPVVAPGDDPKKLLDPVPDGTTVLKSRVGKHDLGRNGTYLVFRQLAQDVATFWNCLDRATLDQHGKSNPSERDRLGAKLVGRWKSGAPLVLSPKDDNPDLASRNDFAYFSKDPLGHSCPIGSHIRRSNPRDSLGPDTKTALDSANRHRILRRGRSYGPHIENPLVDDGKKRGLFFICLNSDIERQFEFVQQTWINNPVFGGLDGEVDPLIGNLPKNKGIFTVPGHPLRTRVNGLSRFVTVKGGAYFFLPSIKALQYLANLQGKG